MKSVLNLKDSIDSFFDNVMVNAEDDKVRSSRLALIRRVRHLFLSVADVFLAFILSFRLLSLALYPS